MTALRLRQSLVILACTLGGAVATSLLLRVGAMMYFGSNDNGLTSFLSTANPVAGICGAAFGIAVFARTELKR